MHHRTGAGQSRHWFSAAVTRRSNVQHRDPARWVLVSAFSLMAVALVCRGWVAHHSWWLGDDFVAIDHVQNAEGAWQVLMTNINGHLAPGLWYLIWLMTKKFPYNWDLAAASILLVQVLAMLGMLRFLLVAFGRRWGILPPLALYLTSPFIVQGTVWWVVSVTSFTTLAALGWSMAAQISYLRTGRRRSAVGAALWVLVGLAFSERSLLVIGALAFVTFAYFCEGSFRQRAHMVWQRYRFSVVINTVLGLAYLVVYVTQALNFSPGQSTSTPIGPVLEVMVLRSWATGIFGGPFAWTAGTTPAAAPPSALVVLCLVLLGLLIRELARVRAGSMRALALPAYFLAFDVLLVVAARAALVGPVIGFEYRYIQEMAMVTPMALALATMPIRNAVEQVTAVGTSGLLDSRKVATLACATVVSLSAYSTAGYVHRWNTGLTQSETWVRNLLSSAEALPKGTAVIDSPAPTYVAWPIAYPANMASHLVSPLRPGLRFTDSGDEHLRAVADDGRIGPVTLAVALRDIPVGDPACRHRVSRWPEGIVLEGPAAFGGWWVRVGYLATGDGAIQVSAGGLTHSTEVRAGFHVLYFRAGDETFDSIRLGPIAGPASLCTSDVAVGRPQAQVAK